MTDLEQRVREVAPNGVSYVEPTPQATKREWVPCVAVPTNRQALVREGRYKDVSAIVEALRRERCDNCGGAGDIWSPVAPVRCLICNGSGLLSPADPELARLFDG